jgi:hypothetical protein
MKCQYCGKEENDNPMNGQIIKVYMRTWFDPDGEEEDYIEYICNVCERARPPMWIYKAED